MEQKISALNRYFEAELQQCEQQSRALLADGRDDEAAFEKIRGNMFDIFRTVLSVATEQGKSDAEAVQRFFNVRIEQIPASWAHAHDKATAHQDVARARVEQIKLDAVAEIKETFARVWEGEQ